MPRFLRRLFRHVSCARLLRDLTGLLGPTSWPLWRRPYIRRRGWGFLHSAPHYPPFSSVSPLHPLLLSALPACSSSVRCNGEGEDGGFGAREEGDGEGEGEEVQPGRIFIEVRSAARLDPGQLDTVDDPLGRHRRSGRGGTDSPRICAAPEE